MPPTLAQYSPLKTLNLITAQKAAQLNDTKAQKHVDIRKELFPTIDMNTKIQLKMSER